MLKATKLGETDVIMTMLAQDGSLSRAVLKGARNPRSKSCGKSEPFIVADLLVAQGRSLDVISEIRIVESFRGVRDDYERTLAGAVALELVAHMIIEESPEPRFYAMTLRFLEELQHADQSQAAQLVVAYFIKMLSFAGYRPVLDCCASCGEVKPFYRVWSHQVGGVLCAECAGNFEGVVPLDDTCLSWMAYYLVTPFAELVAGDSAPTPAQIKTLLLLLTHFYRYHYQGTLKALPLYLELSNYFEDVV